MNLRISALLSGVLLSACVGCGSSDSMFVEYDCFWCKGEGTMQCTACFGKGEAVSLESPTLTASSQVCDKCGGTGMMDCPQCKGKGKVSNNPLAPNP
jgi:DnaJ-class molecular chaperone